ncbi:MAG TPA: NAD(P)H-dependent oxidoreductase [Acetobacteraceae bacterium]
MSDAIRVLGISGSLRKASFNTMALRAAIGLAPPGMVIEECSIREVPFYDGDVETGTGIPAAAEAFRARIRAADALLIVSPEYNASVPGVLKNAIDWASRPPAQPFDGKPIAIMGASPGVFGTVRGQAHLRQVLANVNGLVLPQPQVMIGSAGQRFDAEGNLTDEATRKFVADLLTRLKDWTLKLRAA